MFDGISGFIYTQLNLIIVRTNVIRRAGLSNHKQIDRSPNFIGAVTRHTAVKRGVKKENGVRFTVGFPSHFLQSGFLLWSPQ